MPDTDQRADPQFHTTHWSLIAAAAEPSETSQAALEDLCQAYWYPVYAFIRRRGRSAEDARDLTQEFFATLLEKGYLADADPERGRFRSFLLTAVARFVSKQHEKAAAQKRGGGRPPLSLNFDDGETRYQHEPSHDWTAERIFERRWALTLLDRTLARLRQEHETSGKLPQFEALKVFLTGEAGTPALRQVAENLGTTEGAVKVAIHHLRQKYRDSLREEIAQTVAAQEDVDSELQALLAALRGN
ncbi:MAG TPA: sigma-70 family RNA polymerase sigma factor [Pirellulaceae bacterium]|nr:sigma-70 family RNA polymerase sigma factor [Pirellulaceae bacterium]